jgi:hypothetical protein
VKKKNIFKCLLFLCLIVLSSNTHAQESDSLKNIININSVPPGAEVYLNKVLIGKTPLTLNDQAHGKLEFLIKLDDKNSFQNIIDYKGGEIEMYPMFNTDYALLDIITIPDNALVYLNGSLVAETPIYDFQIPLGLNEIRIEKEDYLTIQKKINFQKKKIRWNHQLTFKYGFVSSNDNSLNISLRVNDSEIPTNEIQSFKVLVGIANFEAKWKNQRLLSKPFNIESRKYYKLSYELGYFNPLYLAESMVLPGLGQFQDNSKLTGVIYFVTTAAFGYLFINENSNHKNNLEKYNSDKVMYNEALNEVQAVELRNIMEHSLDDVNSSTKNKNIYLGCFIGAYLINIIDAVLFHTEGFSIDLIEVNNNIGFNSSLIKFNYPLN